MGHDGLDDEGGEGKRMFLFSMELEGEGREMEEEEGSKSFGRDNNFIALHWVTNRWVNL